MDKFTPSQDKNKHNLYNAGTPFVTNSFITNDSKNSGKNEKKYKTISHQKVYNNLNNENFVNASEKLKNLFGEKEINNILNNTASSINNKKPEKMANDTKSTPKNRKNINLDQKSENKLYPRINIFSKSSNNNEKLTEKNNTVHEKKQENSQNKSEDDSENLSALAEDLLSMSDEFDVQLMRKKPINKKDFLGEFKEEFNYYKKRENDLNNQKKNIMNIGLPKEMPILQTKLYTSPLEKLKMKNLGSNIKNSNKKNYNNIKRDLHNFKLDEDQNQLYSKTQTQVKGSDIKTCESKMKNHISSNSIKNNENNTKNMNKTNNNNNNTILNNLAQRNQIIKNNINTQFNNIDDIFNKTTFNQENKNYINDWNEENTNDLMKIINNTNHSVGKKKIHSKLQINQNHSNRNLKNKSIIKTINTIGIQDQYNNKNEYIGKDQLKSINYNNQIQNNKKNNIRFNIININNINNINNNFERNNNIQNINSINIQSNYNNSNINYNYNSKYTDINQRLRKMETYKRITPNNQKQDNNNEYLHKNINNMNVNNKNNVLNTNTTINNYNIGNKIEYYSQIQNKKIYPQTNKLLRKSDFNRVSNKNVVLKLNEVKQNLRNINNNNQQTLIDKNSLLNKGNNKNSYTNIHNYMNINYYKPLNENKYKNINKDIISQKNLNTFKLNNYDDNYKIGNMHYYQEGNDNTFDYIGNINYLDTNCLYIFLFFINSKHIIFVLNIIIIENRNIYRFNRFTIYKISFI